jgi:hypothetical protein
MVDFFFFINFIQNSILSELHFLFAGKSAKIGMAEGSLSLIAVDCQHNEGKYVMLIERHSTTLDSLFHKVHASHS